MKNVLCACCLAEITKPVFIKGKPYGYSCAKKFQPNGLKRPSKKMIELEVLSIENWNESGTIQDVRFLNEEGKRRLCKCNITTNGGTYMNPDSLVMEGNRLYRIIKK